MDQLTDVEGALVSIELETGDILSLVGGANFEKSQFNRALQSLRQPGSAFKPILFAAALENGFTPSSIIVAAGRPMLRGTAAFGGKPSRRNVPFGQAKAR